MGFFRKLQGFRRNDDGVITIEFVLLLPMILALVFWVIEIGVLSMRWVTLENALDKTMRDVRITNFVAEYDGARAQHDALKDRICQYASTLSSCQADVKLELIPADANGGAPDAAVSCTDRAVDPDTTSNEDYLVTLGNPIGLAEREIMFARACILIDPIVPPAFAQPILLGATGGEGEQVYALVSTNAFVLEP